MVDGFVGKMDSLLKLNLGCGEHHREGYINVDKHGSPDVLHDLESFPWPWKDNSVKEIRLYHVLEHLGQSNDIFFGIIKELYRISVSEAEIHIDVPHPRHDHFIGDPTHVRIITPDVLSLFSKSKNLEWVRKGAPNSPLGLYLDVDFEIADTTFNLDSVWAEKLKKKEVSESEIYQAMNMYNNVVMSIKMVLKVVK